MPLSKGAIAAIVVAAVIVVGVSIYLGVTLGGKKTPTPGNGATYNCDAQTGCQTVDAGASQPGKYKTLQDCQAASACQKKTCSNTSGKCDQDAATYQDVTDCNSSCQVLSYNCDATQGCISVPGTSGRYTTRELCSAACHQQYCNSTATAGTCTPSTNAGYQDDTDCTNTCKPNQQTYICDAKQGCIVTPSGMTPQFNTLDLCQKTAHCVQQSCTLGQCTADSSAPYITDSACAANCLNNTYDCVSGTCTRAAAGKTGRYANIGACNTGCKAPPPPAGTGFNCVNGSCVTPATGTGQYSKIGDCQQACSSPPPVNTGCSMYRPTVSSLSSGVDYTVGAFTDKMSKTYGYPFTSVRITYSDPKNSDTVVTGQRLLAYVGDWVDSGATKFAQWASTYGIDPTYSITGNPNVPFLYVPQLGTIGNISNVGNAYYDPTKPYAQDARTLNKIPGVLIENLGSGRSYRFYMGQPPSMQASERFADNHFGYHNPLDAGSNLRNMWYWNFRERTDALPMDTAYLSASTDLYSSYQDPNSKTCFYYQGNMLSTEAMSAKLWPHGPATQSSDAVYVDFTDSAPLNGQFGVVSGAGFNAKGIDLPNKNGPSLASVLVKPNVNVGNNLIKNVLELRTYISYGNNAFKVTTSGGLISAKKFASGRYEIRAKVGNRPGMVWAIWTFSAVYKLPSPMTNCGTGKAACVACTNCSDYSTCCSLCSSTPSSAKCGTCGAGGSPCALDGDCSASGGHCVIPAQASQCNCQQCVTSPLPPDADSALCSGRDCSAAVACSWDTSKTKCLGAASCAQYTTQDACNNATPCQGNLTWKTSAPPVGIPTPWNSTPTTPVNIYYVGNGDINDPSSAGPNYHEAAAGSVEAGALMGGLPCSSYFNAEIDFCEIPSNAPFFSNTPTPPPDTVRPTAHTANLNTYRFTNSAGTGTYTNYYTQAQPQATTGKTQAFIGDGCYHTYAYEWHTGDSAQGVRPKVDAFFDGDYTGSSDSFVPDVYSRLWIVSWNSGNPNWNGYLGNNPYMWDDVNEVVSTKVAPVSGTSLYNVNYIDYIRVTPFNEANDKYLPDPLDQSNMNQVIDPTQVGVDPTTGNKLPGGSGLKPGSCCALVQQPSPYDGTTNVNMCTNYAYHALTGTGINWLNPTMQCAAPLNGSKVAPTVMSQTFVPFFQTKTAITTADGTKGFGVVWDASSNELSPGPGPGPGPSNTCAGADVACPKGDADCSAYLVAQKCPTTCTSYCRTDQTNPHCHISC